MADTVSPQLADSGRSPTQPEARQPTRIEEEKDNGSSSGKEKGAKNMEQGHEELLKPGTKKQAKIRASKAAVATQQRERYELSMRLEEEKFFAFMQGRPFVPGMQCRALASAKRINDLGAVTYPEGIQAPSKKLEGTILGGRYKYDREFLLQFKLFCRDKPQFSSNLDGLGVERPPPLAESDLSRFHYAQGSMGRWTQRAVGGSGGLNSGSPGGVASQLPTRSRTRTPRVDPNNIPPPQQQQPVHEATFGSTKAAASLRACKNPWTPWSVGRNKRTQGQNSLEFTERKVQALLNKLASKNFDAILGQVLGLANTSEDEKKGPVLDLIAKLVLEQASETPLFVEVFARFSKEMTAKLPAGVRDGNIRNPAGKPIAGGQLFRKYLLDRCKEDTMRSMSVVRTGLSNPSAQDDKVSGVRFEDEANNKKPALFSDQYYIIYKAKRQSLNLTRFTGELFKVQMLTERIIHELIKIRLAKINNPETDEIEMLCILVKTVGQELDTPKAKGHINIYFERMAKLVDSNKLPSRLKFMLMDVMDLRKRNWGPRERTAQPREQQSQGTSQEKQDSKPGRKSRRKKSPSRIASTNNAPSASENNNKGAT
ncbi:hypothetical protein FRC04_011215 [Tulasnella sp. 424]|nr:hypothetical protein FRC04_011215 [Tulasnella sp. 424]